MLQEGLILWLALLIIGCSCLTTQDPVSKCLEENKSYTDCINPNSTDQQVVCSWRGECICGYCYCFPRRRSTEEVLWKRYSGQYCQCDDYSCSFYDNQLCGGVARGRCDCGNCVCMEGYMGEACDCDLSNKRCLTSNGKVCNGVGDCECGVCTCHANSSYTGPRCEECPTCLGYCEEHRNCVLCSAFGTGEYSKEECESKCPDVRIVDSLDTDSFGYYEFPCKLRDDTDGCLVLYSYRYVSDLNEQLVTVQRKKDCSGAAGPGVNHSMVTTVLGGFACFVLRQIST